MLIVTIILNVNVKAQVYFCLMIYIKDVIVSEERKDILILHGNLY